MTCALCSRGDANGDDSRVLPKTTLMITTTTTTTTMMTTTTTRPGGVGAQVSPLFRSPSHDSLMLRYPKSTGEEGRAMTTTMTRVDGDRFPTLISTSRTCERRLQGIWDGYSPYPRWNGYSVRVVVPRFGHPRHTLFTNGGMYRKQ